MIERINYLKIPRMGEGGGELYNLFLCKESSVRMSFKVLTGRVLEQLEDYLKQTSTITNQPPPPPN